MTPLVNVTGYTRSAELYDSFYTPRGKRYMKAKIHAVTLDGKTHLVWAITRAGAIRDVLESLKDQMTVDVATGEQIYAAGIAKQTILGGGKYANMVDQNQQDLPLPATGASHE